MTLFVIGKPINHSLSPLIHNFWIKKYQIDLEYKKMEVDKDTLPSLKEKVRRREITGLNVTLPYKKDIIMYNEYANCKAAMQQSTKAAMQQGSNASSFLWFPCLHVFL